jgi:glycerophosphoryl diester phosphodiesterase
MNQFRAATTPLIIAHRGSSAHAPENTLAAFRLAADQGAHAIELDAKLSADGQVVVFHDRTVERTTNGKGAIQDLSLAEMKALDAGSFFGAQYAGEPIPTLEEVFAEVGQRVLINVELTNYAAPFDSLVPRVADLVRNFHLEERIVFSSFHPYNLYRAAQLLPEVPRAILAGPARSGWWARSLMMRPVSPEAVNPYYSDATAFYLQRQHDNGRRVYVWTVNQEDEIKRLIREGADGIITDDPPLALKLLAESAPRDPG